MATKYRELTVNNDNLEETVETMQELFDLFSRGNGTSSIWFMGRDTVSGYLLIDGNIVEQEARYLTNPRYHFDTITAYLI